MVFAMPEEFASPSTARLLTVMDHEKPEALNLEVTESLRESACSPMTLDIEYARAPSPDEPADIEERKDMRGDNVWCVFSYFRHLRT